jgi:hypothetical protein
VRALGGFASSRVCRGERAWPNLLAVTERNHRVEGRACIPPEYKLTQKRKSQYDVSDNCWHVRYQVPLPVWFNLGSCQLAPDDVDERRLGQGHFCTAIRGLCLRATSIVLASMYNLLQLLSKWATAGVSHIWTTSAPQMPIGTIPEPLYGAIHSCCCEY